MTQDTDREIMQQALEALEASIALTMTKIELRNEAIAALREALAEQPVQEPYCYVYASRLAKHLWKKHYMKDAPQWKPFDDLIGVLTQIDNMTTGLTRLEQPVQDGWHTHDLYTDADKDRPDVICDRNGSVTLGLCKRCGRGESQLAEPCDKQPVQEPVAHSIVAGALFDFMGWLTSRKKRIVLSSADDAGPAADAIKDFAQMRSLSINDAQVQEWQEHLAAPQPRQWQGLTDEELQKIYEDHRPYIGSMITAVAAKLREKNT